MDKYSFSFDSRNSNSLLIKNKENGRIIKMICCPPIESGIDIINMNGETFDSGYTYNFKGFIIITTKQSRKLYCEGKLLAKTRRNLNTFRKGYEES